MPLKLPRRRVEEWLQTLDSLEELCAVLRRVLGRVTVVLYGSYARGDFNLWSDVDAIVVSEAFQGLRALDRYELLPRTETPRGLQAIPLTPEEFREALRKPSWRHALGGGGHALVCDDYGLADALRDALGSVVWVGELRRRVERLLENTV